MLSESTAPLNVVLMWHMHQPEYRNLATGEYQLPWTYLHALKDYTDMAAHLEQHPQARAVVNFAPILVEQLQSYPQAIDQAIRDDQPLPDKLLQCLRLDDYSEVQEFLVQSCLRANEERIIKRYPEFQRLVDIAQEFSEAGQLDYLGNQYFSDLLVWYHLGWMGESVKAGYPAISALIEKGSHFDADDRCHLLREISQIIAEIVPRYRRLSNEGQVELAMSPYAHPIVPLLIDFNTAREAATESPLPSAAEYPDGSERAHWHMQHGIAVFEKHFGIRPVGCWPSEGGVSTEAAKLFAYAGFNWMASGDQVLKNSLHANKLDVPETCRHRTYGVEGSNIAAFFRDDGLSDLIGFNYATWHADDAVGDLINHLHTIRTHCDDPQDRVVSIIMDGENAWEYYPENARYFLDALYARLAADPTLNLTTYSALLEKQLPRTTLPTLTAGSWVYGDFSTWIGDKDKNRGWDLLCQTRNDLDAWLELNPERKNDHAVLNQLAICEGSDWFWWFGDYNPSGSVKDFDDLYRLNLQNIYKLMDQQPPAALFQSISQGNNSSAMETGGVMRRGGD